MNNFVKPLEQRKQEWIERATIAFDGFYCYDKVDYIDSNTKVCIICPEHGEFWQRPRDHGITTKCHKRKMGKTSCKGCQKKYGRRRISPEEWIKSFTKVHPEYDFLVTEEFIKGKTRIAHTKVPVECKEHGTFWIRTDHLKKGRGCKKCTWGDNPYAASCHRYDTKTFIEKSISIHGERYCYDKVNYTHSTKKVTIICKEHGPFKQAASSHLQGFGCRSCSNGKRTESNTRNILEKLLGIPLPSTLGLNWLKNPETDCYLELDGYNDEYKIAFEFHGKQHYEVIDFWGGKEGLERQQKRDKVKRSACMANGICLVEIDGRKIPDSTRKTKERLRPAILQQLLNQPEWKKKRLLPLLKTTRRQNEETNEDNG